MNQMIGMIITLRLVQNHLITIQHLKNGRNNLMGIVEFMHLIVTIIITICQFGAQAISTLMVQNHVIWKKMPLSLIKKFN